jgi:hypothetical protein
MEESMRVKGLDDEINTAETKCHATAKNKGRHAVGKYYREKMQVTFFKRIKRSLHDSKILSVKRLQVN